MGIETIIIDKHEAERVLSDQVPDLPEGLTARDSFLGRVCTTCGNWCSDPFICSGVLVEDGTLRIDVNPLFTDYLVHCKLPSIKVKGEEALALDDED